MITLAKTASRCHRSPAEMIGIRDAEIAFAFDVECEDILLAWERELQDERDRIQFAAITGQAVTSVLGGQPAKKNPNVRRW